MSEIATNNAISSLDSDTAVIRFSAITDLKLIIVQYLRKNENKF